MGSKSLPVHDRGIYKSLPTFPDSIKNLTAIVTGANGISGFHTMRVLLESPNRWKKVYAISRRPPPAEMMNLLPAEHRQRVEHVASDFLNSPEDIAKALKEKGVKADVVFFYSYLQPKPEPGKGAWSNAQELVDVNGALFRNFLAALPLASINPTRILLQTGAKNYGVHLGPCRSPAIESDPRVLLEPNFYYPQEDDLFAHCRAHPHTSWTVIRPSWIIGAVQNAQMNIFYPLAVYAAVQAERGHPMAFPGSLAAWQSENYHATAMLTGYLSEWAVLEEAGRDQAFNATDTSPLPWNRVWPEMGRWFGCEHVATRPELDEGKFTSVVVGHDPPPLGYGPPSTFKFSFSFVRWASQPENQEAWRRIMQKHHLTHNPFEDVEADFTFADAAMALSITLSMIKARRAGWTGFVDTVESVFQSYEEMGRLGMLPPMQVKEARPCV